MKPSLDVVLSAAVFARGARAVVDWGSLRCPRDDDASGTLPTPSFGSEDIAFTICSEIVIGRPRAAVYAAVLDFRAYPRWNTFVVDVRVPPNVTRTDSIDLYYLHAANPETPIEETMRALAQLQAEGKIKHIGLSNVSSATLRRAYRVAPVAAVQAEYSVTERGVEGGAGTDLLAACRALGVALVCETPLGRGLLSSAFASAGGAAAADADDDLRARALPRFRPQNRGPNAAAVAPFCTLADRRGCSVSQLALAWLLKQGHDIFPIPGTKTIKYLEENCAAAGIHLSDEDEAEIRALAERTQIVGGTVPEQFADHLFRDTKPEVSPGQ